VLSMLSAQDFMSCGARRHGANGRRMQDFNVFVHATVLDAGCRLHARFPGRSVSSPNELASQLAVGNVKFVALDLGTVTGQGSRQSTAFLFQTSLQGSVTICGRDHEIIRA
jgi:hypothetical protein